jgi:hypothetical protein
MEKNRVVGLSILIVLLIIVFVGCPGSRKNAEPKTTITTIVQIDTVRICDTVYFPKPYKVEPVSIPEKLDTANIITDYFTVKYYNIDYTDSLIKATTQIKLLNNAIESTILDYQMLQKHTFTNIRETYSPRFGMSIGGSVSYSIINHKPGMELNTTFRIKSHHLLIGYDFINQSPRLGWQYQITKN